MNFNEAYLLIGGLSFPSKMPWFGWSIAATACKVGSRLREVEGSICSKCYARKGRYSFLNVQKAMARRLSALEHPRFVEAFILVLNTLAAKTKRPDFRWFDSGDVQSAKHMRQIIEIAKGCPTVRFRMPSKELALLRKFEGQFPSNLIVSYSVPMIGQPIIKGLSLSQSTTSKEKADLAFNCPATFSSNHKCGSCDACWKPHKQINYGVH
jgi:hypothetical protein